MSIKLVRHRDGETSVVSLPAEEAGALRHFRDLGVEIVHLVAAVLFAAFFAVAVTVAVPECFGAWVCQ